MGDKPSTKGNEFRSSKPKPSWSQAAQDFEQRTGVEINPNVPGIDVHSPSEGGAMRMFIARKESARDREALIRDVTTLSEYKKSKKR